MLNSAQLFYGRAFVGDTIVWAARGKAGAVLLVTGRVESITDGGNLWIIVSAVDRPEVDPGQRLLATGRKSMVVKRA